jgi:hypothetical protein
MTAVYRQAVVASAFTYPNFELPHVPPAANAHLFRDAAQHYDGGQNVMQMQICRTAN